MSKILKAIVALRPSYGIAIRGADHYENIDWNGHTPIPKSELLAAIQDTENLEEQGVKINATKTEALVRIRAQVAALKSMETVDLIVILWPMLDVASAPTALLLVKAIDQYAKEKIQWLGSVATDVEVATYNPIIDPDWPV